MKTLLGAWEGWGVSCQATESSGNCGKLRPVVRVSDAVGRESPGCPFPRRVPALPKQSVQAARTSRGEPGP